MNGLQFGNDEDINVGGGHSIFKVKSHRFADVLVEFIDGFALRENIFPDSTRAPKTTVIVDFDFYQHSVILQRLRAVDHPCFLVLRGSVAGDAGEVGGEACNPDGDEGGKADDGVEHLVGVGPVIGVEVGLQGIIERKKEERENRAAEPREPRGEELQRGFGLVWTEPKLFIWKIDELGGDAFKNAGDAKRHDRGYRDGANEECEKHRFRLPAVRDAAAIEVGRDSLRQLRVAGRKIDRREDSEHDENTSGQSRILHGVL